MKVEMELCDNGTASFHNAVVRKWLAYPADANVLKAYLATLRRTVREHYGTGAVVRFIEKGRSRK